jgi:hypothetical protein
MLTSVNTHAGPLGCEQLVEHFLRARTRDDASHGELLFVLQFNLGPQSISRVSRYTDRKFSVSCCAEVGCAHGDVPCEPPPSKPLGFILENLRF